MKKSCKNFFFYFSQSLFLGLFMSIFAFAQVTTGSLQGIIKDQAGAVVPGASVKVTNNGTGQVRETVTNSDGFYRVNNLQPGDAYQVEIISQTFESKVIKNVSVRLGTESSVDIELGVKGVGAVVTVVDEAPLINTTQNQLSTSYSEKQLTQLPYNGGSIDNLALLTPGVITPGDADFTNGVGISANGNRGRSNNFQLDGQDNNDNSVAGPTLSLTNTEAIGDYQVTTNNPSAEFGRNAGAQINVVTKAGSNAFHGSLFEYLQNSALDTTNNLQKKDATVLNFLANNGFSQFRGLANRNGKDPFSFNRFGGALGGPIKKDKAFFFVTFQADVQNGELSANNFGSGGLTFTPQSVQTAASLGFPGATQILASTRPGGGPAFTNVPGQFFVLPALKDANGDGLPDSFVNVGGAYTNSLFVRNGSGTLIPLQTGEVLRITPNRAREYQVITKEDFNITSKDILNVRYIFDKAFFPDTPATGSVLSGAFFDVPSKNNNLGVTYTRLINSNYTNEARFNFSRLNVQFGDTSAVSTYGPSIGFTGQRDAAGNFTSLGFGTGNTLPQSRKVDVYQEQDTLSTTIGNHAVKVGLDLRQQKVDNFFLPNFLGVYRFAAAGTLTNSSTVCTLCNFYSSTGVLRTGTPFAFENLLLARPDRITFALGNPNIKTNQNDYFFFVQDDWRFRPNLTLNLGLRYEYSTSPFNPIIDAVNTRESNSSTAIFSSAFPLSARTATRLETDKNNFAPRVGFAYSPNFKLLGDRFSNGRTVLRAGFGIAYDPSYFNIVLNTVTAAPYAAAGFIQQTPGAAGSVSYPFLPTTTAQLNTTPSTNGGDPRLFNQTRVDPGFYSPYTMQWNAGIQQEVFKSSVVEVRYVGSKFVGQFQTVNGNPNIRYLNNAAQCLGLNAGTYTGGRTVGTAAASTAAACSGLGYQNGVGTNGNGRLDPTFGAVRLRTNGAQGNYHGLQTRFDTRFSDIVFNANYTFSKTIDNASEIFSTGAGGQAVAVSQNPFNTTGGERALSAFNQKHNFTANFVYELPFYKEQNGLVGKLLGGYQVSGLFRIGSGRPYTPVVALGNIDTGFEGSFLGLGVLRPFDGNTSAPNSTIAFGYAAACDVLFGGPECDYNGGTATPGSFIIYDTAKPGSVGRVVANAQAAIQNSRLIYNDFGLFQYGEPFTALEAFSYFKTPYGVGRNTLTGNNFVGVNMALFKTTRINESMKVEFRVEANNLLNKRNFGVPDAVTEDAFNGIAVSSYNNPGFNNGSVRSLRFGLRFLF